MRQFKHAYKCLDEHCRTITVTSREIDGLRCPRCEGPVVPQPFKKHKEISEDALYVRRMILQQCHEHCFDLTPEQVDTVLDIYKSKKESKFLATVSITDTDIFKDLLNLTEDVLTDERISDDTKDRYVERLENIVNNVRSLK